GTAAVISVNNEPPAQQDELAGWLCGGGFVLFFVWVIFAAIYSTRGVRPVEITVRFIRLAGVHEDFVAALEADRDRDADERDRRGRLCGGPGGTDAGDQRPPPPAPAPGA